MNCARGLVGEEGRAIETGKFAATVKVGAKGQVVIPQAARAMFGIGPGDTLLLLADPERGIAIVRSDVFDDFIDTVTRAKSAED